MLTKITRVDAASSFFGEEFVPRRAITMGVGTIMAAKKVSDTQAACAQSAPLCIFICRVCLVVCAQQMWNMLHGCCLQFMSEQIMVNR